MTPGRTILICTVVFLAAACRPPGQHFRGEIVDIDGDVLGRYWLARQPESVFNLPEPPRADCGDGYVVVRYVIDSLGNVFESTVLSAEPTECYENAALMLVDSWSFVAAPVNRRRTPVRVTQRIPFVTE